MDYRIQRLKEDLTLAQQRNKKQKKANVSLKRAYDRLQKQKLELQKEHSIMIRIIKENGLWETLLNDDEFLEHLRSDN